MALVKCKWCGKAILDSKDIGFLLRVSDEQECEACKKAHCGDKGWEKVYSYMEMPCLTCNRTSIQCKKCGAELLQKQINFYQQDNSHIWLNYSGVN